MALPLSGGKFQLVQVSVSSNRNKARVLEMVDRVMNGHDVSALSERASNPGVYAPTTSSGACHEEPALALCRPPPLGL